VERVPTCRKGRFRKGRRCFLLNSPRADGKLAREPEPESNYVSRLPDRV
jgi:hypothetical protein